MFTLTIETGNAAFGDDNDKRFEIARILRDIAGRIDCGLSLDGTARDTNGNTVAKFFHTD